MLWMELLVLTVLRQCLGITKAEHRAAVMSLIKTYLHQHNAGVLRKELKASTDELCRRRFVSNLHFDVGCVLIGNKLGAFLSNLVYAVALNRTIVLTHDNNMNTQCSGFMGLRDWIVSRAELERMLTEARCPLTDKAIDYFWTPPCGYSESSARVLTSDALFNADYIFLQDQYDSSMSSFVKNRSHILFGSPFEDNARFEAFGLLMLKAFHFSPGLHHALYTILKQSHEPNSFRVSIQLRHKNEKSIQNPSLDIPFDDLALKALADIVQRNRDLNCIVYLASDRKASIDRIQLRSKELGCVPFVVNRSTEWIQPGAYQENGLWALGFVQLADIYLLGHGDYFIGSRESTYSILIANLVSANALQKDNITNPFLWLSGTTEVTPYFEKPDQGKNCLSGKYHN